MAEHHPDWAVGFEDDTWWSHVAQPAVHAWSDVTALRLVEQTVAKDDADPRALACYGLLVLPAVGCSGHHYPGAGLG